WTITTESELPIAGLTFKLPAESGITETITLVSGANPALNFTIPSPGTYQYTSNNGVITGNIVVSDFPSGANDLAGLAAGKDLGGNIIGAAADLSASITTTLDSGTLVGVDAKLAGAPADNGGLTPTIALLEDSPAVNAALSAYAPSVDQRGLLRVGAPDIGAYEYGADTAPATSNAAYLTADQESAYSGQRIDFTLAAQLLEADNVNAVEVVLAYDPAVFNAIPSILAADGFEVASAFVSAEKGLISLVIGVVNDKTISYDVPSDLARIGLTVKQGQTPTSASVSVNSFKVYSRGVLLDSEIAQSSAATPIDAQSSNPQDVNKDGAVNGVDLSLALYYYGAVDTDADWDVKGAADIDGDGDVDMADILSLVNSIHASL
ncbi:MAG: dockerin type I repeat-containing protein, partial [Gracilibacteraceae bacterium]|nr:dockerin type I repeat-containing protein [Gracilibacteraceae bacterium]